MREPQRFLDILLANIPPSNWFAGQPPTYSRLEHFEQHRLRPTKERRVAIRDIDQRLDRVLSGYGFLRTQRDEISMATIEMLTNACDHSTEKRRFVRLDLFIVKDPVQALVAIRDHGQPYQPPRPEETAMPDWHRRSGRGFAIVYALVNAIGFAPACNLCVMVFQRQGPPGAGIPAVRR